MTAPDFGRILAAFAALSGALAEVAARTIYALLAVAAVFGAAVLRGVPDAAAVVDSAGWVAVALLVAFLAFTAAAELLGEQGDAEPEAVTA